MIIDIHAHIWGGDIQEHKRRVMAGIDRYGIDKVYISGLKNHISDEEEIAFLNEAVYQFMKEQPERIGGAVYVNPLHKNVLDVIKRATEEQGFEMIKLWCCTTLDDPSVDPIMVYAEENGLPVLFHAFKKSNDRPGVMEYTGAQQANIARRHPKTKILMAHFGGSAYDGIPAIRDLKNVWSDQSGTPYHGEEITYAVEQLGEDRVVFGTDNAYITNIGQVMGADLTQKQRDKIFYKNALNLLDRSYRL